MCEVVIICRSQITLSTSGHHDIHDITAQVQRLVQKSRIQRGLVHRFNVGLFPPDTLDTGKAKGNLQTTCFSSPQRYHTIMNIARLIRTIPELKLPVCDRTATLHNDDTIASRPHDGFDTYGKATQTCHTFLEGPKSRSA